MKNKLYLIIILFFIESLQIIAQDLKSNKLISLDKIEEINVQIDNLIKNQAISVRNIKGLIKEQMS